MKRSAVIAVLMVLFSMCAGSVSAEGIGKRLGLTGQVGFSIPSQSDLNIDSAFVGGGGLIYGFNDILAIEAHVAYAPAFDVSRGNAYLTTLHTVDTSLGLQIRNNISESDLSVYLGGGVDVLFVDADDVAGLKADVDTVVGGHVNVGADYFITKNVALNMDLRGAFFPDTDITVAGRSVATYQPISFIGLFGVRYFLW